MTRCERFVPARHYDGPAAGLRFRPLSWWTAGCAARRCRGL